MDGITIRAATLDDLPFLRAMQWEALLASPQFMASMGLDALHVREEQLWSTWPAPGEIAFVAEAPGPTPLGAVFLRVHERVDERVVGYRLAIAVRAERRGEGIGRRLIEHAKRYSVASGADYLVLFVDTSNQRAIHLYEATGFALGDQHGVVPMIIRHRDP